MAESEDDRRAVVMIVDGAEVVVWEPPVGVRPDLAVIDHLARLQLQAMRRGCTLRMRNPCVDMLALVRLVGLAEMFGIADASVEVQGNAERLEQLRVQEVVQPEQLAVLDLEDLEGEG